MYIYFPEPKTPEYVKCRCHFRFYKVTMKLLGKYLIIKYNFMITLFSYFKILGAIDNACNTPSSGYLRIGSKLLRSSWVTSKLTNLKDSNEKWTEATLLVS